MGNRSLAGCTPPDRVVVYQLTAIMESHPIAELVMTYGPTREKVFVPESPPAAHWMAAEAFWNGVWGHFQPATSPVDNADLQVDGVCPRRCRVAPPRPRYSLVRPCLALVVVRGQDLHAGYYVVDGSGRTDGWVDGDVPREMMDMERAVRLLSALLFPYGTTEMRRYSTAAAGALLVPVPPINRNPGLLAFQRLARDIARRQRWIAGRWISVANCCPIYRRSRRAGKSTIGRSSGSRRHCSGVSRRT